jgi:hypothetical protein
MSLFTWLQHRTRRFAGQRRTMHGSPLRQTTFRPRLEVLEDRDVPSTLTVTNNLDTGVVGDGSLRGEIAAAGSGDTIAFAPSLSGQTIALSSTNGELKIAWKNLTIQGPGAGQLTIGGGYSRVFEVDGSTTNVTLSGLSIIDGIGTAYYPYGNTAWGGGHSSATGTAQDGQGGAIWNGGTLTVNGCTIAYNSAAVHFDSNFAGGGIYNAGTLIVSNSTLAHNSVGDTYGYSGNGGGIYNAGTLTVNGSTLYDNIAYGGYGGGIFSGYKSTVAITGSTLTFNYGSLGGGIYDNGSMTLSGCTVSGNLADSEGGGIFNDKYGKLTIQSGSVVKNNTAPLGADLFELGWVKISSDSTVGVIAT